jgi:predicted Zn-dependent peptidase
MEKLMLKNGMKILVDRRKSSTVTIEMSVNVGSNCEQRNIAGISHFLEHMIFEGTKKRSAKQISEAIENVGGELNAATTNERTFFYIKVPKAKMGTGFDIISDMIRNPAFELKILEKERNVVLEEIKMVNDQPLLYQWVLFESNIFKQHPTRNPVYGRVDSVKSISRQQMLRYYRSWYSPSNMTLSVVGDVGNIKALANKYFGDMPSAKALIMKKVTEPKDTKPTIKVEKRDINQSYLVMGFKTVPRLHKDSFVLDVIASVFSKGISGRINEEVRIKRGLAYSVGSVHESKKDYGFFVFYLNCDRKNLETCKSIILDEIRKLDNLGSRELVDAKEHLIGRDILDLEDSHKRADELAFWESLGDARLADRYTKEVKKVTKKDIIRVRNRFFDKNYTMVVIGK